MNEEFTAEEWAFYMLVKNFRKGQTPSGSAALAPLVGMNPKTLSSKVNPNDDTHKLSAAEGVLIMAASKNYTPIEAQAASLGGVFTLLPQLDGTVQNEEILTLFLEVTEEQGQFAETIKQSLKDGKISPNELKEITREGYEGIAKVQQLMMVLTEKCNTDQHA